MLSTQAPVSLSLLHPFPHHSSTHYLSSDGVLVPLIYTLSDVQTLVKAAKFPPIGARGFGSPFPMERFHPDITSAQYLQQANDATLVCVQVETKEALEDVENIAAVDGVDVLFVGPFDLGNNIGRPILDGTMHEECELFLSTLRKLPIHDPTTDGNYHI